MVVFLEKILLVGLDNSGKTSTIYILQRKFSLLTNIKPTIKYNRTSFHILGMELTIFDLGGQEKYREEHLKTPIFNGTHLLFYIIDMQDSNRFIEVLSYLERILENYKNLNYFPKIIIFLHKMDPDIIKDLKIIENEAKLKYDILQVLNKFQTNIEIEFFRTTIYDEISIISAFSTSLLKINKKSNIITNVLKEFCNKTFSSVVLLLDENSFIIGSYANEENEKYIELCKTVAPRFTIVMEKMEKFEVNIENIIINVQGSLDDKAFIFIRSFVIDENSISYVVSLSKNNKTIQLCLNYLPNLAENLKNFLNSFI